MKITKSSLVALMGVLLVGCSDDNPFANLGEGQGLIRPLVSTDASVIDAKPTRDQEAIPIPDVNDFSVTLTKTGGSEQHWASVADFPADKGFAIGDYTLAVDFGDIEIEGLNSPCFHGETTFTVFPDEIAEPKVTASLANSMISVEYSDAFKLYFKEYTTEFHSEGHGYPKLMQGETGPIYVAPGQTAVTLYVTRQDGSNVTLTPAGFLAQAKHHYHMKLDVNNGGVANVAQLVITFDDSLAEENVEIDLSNELMTTPGPQVEPTGFASGEAVSVLKGTGTGTLKYDVFAFGGITEAKLNVQSADYTLPIGSGNEIDLTKLDASQQSFATSLGIECKGLFKNVDKMATVDITKFASSLPAGAHTITLVVKDRFTRTNQPVSVTVSVVPVTLTLEEVPAVQYNDTEALAVIGYNGNKSDINNFTFKVLNDAGMMVDAPITDVKESPRSLTRVIDAFPVKLYDVTLSIPASSRNQKIVLYNANGEKVGEDEIKHSAIVYTATVDAYATKAVIKATAEPASRTAALVKGLRVFVNGTEVAASNLVKDADNGTVTVKGLNPATAYTIATTMDPNASPKMTTSESVTTEAAAQVPNGDFENLATEYSATINQGGKYSRTKIGSASGQNTQEFNVSAPTGGWVTTNAKTYGAGSPENSWFKNFSVFNSSLSFITHEAIIGGMGGTNFNKDNDKISGTYNFAAQNGSNAMVIRNVGWSTNGTLPDDYANTAATPGNNYNSRNTPSGLSVAAGKLFLGSYSYAGGSETINEGVSFTSRPTSLSGYYRYIADSNDSSEAGVITVTLLNGSTVIASGSKNLTSADSFTDFNVPLTYVSTAKATTLKIMITSSNRSESNIKVSNRTGYVQSAYGAVLVVDNLTFTY